MIDMLRYWSKGVRLYIALGTLLVSALVVWWAQTAYGGSSLVSIRTEEVFAWLATGLLAAAVSIGPVYKLFPRLGGRQIWSDARRLIGVSAAWFAALHVGIAYIALFKSANPFSLPGNYKLAFLLGVLALLGLLAMAFTSFDGAFRTMGVWWFRLHRVVYAVIVLTLFHIFMIGAHASLLPVVVLLAIACAVVLAAYVAISIRARKISGWQFIGVSVMAVLLVWAVCYGIQQRNIAIAHEPNTSKLSRPS